MIEPTTSDTQLKKREGTPRIYLDARSILTNVGFFEGTEKLLEVWLSPGDTSSPDVNIENDGEEVANNDGKVESANLWTSLRCISEAEWNYILKHYAKCSVLSVISNDKTDAYILNESSLIVYDYKFILKTCGSTTPLPALQPIMTLAREKCNLSRVRDVFYSRRGYTNPLGQIRPHHSFDDEVKYLNGLFESGSAYILGRLNGDPWYLYVLDNNDENPQPDQTLEILMTSLPTEIMSHFTLAVHPTAEEMCEVFGVKQLFPGFRFDLKAFDPCGFSLNGINAEFYINCHVTPQIECSYVSIETNWSQEDFTEIVKKLISTFNPRNTLLTLFVNQASKCPNSLTGVKYAEIKGYTCMDKQYCEFPNSYNVTLLSLSK